MDHIPINFLNIVHELPLEVCDIIIQETIKTNSYQTLIDFLLDYSKNKEEYRSSPIRAVESCNVQNGNIKRLRLTTKQNNFKDNATNLLYMKYIVELFDYMLDYGTICIKIKHSDIRLRTITLQAKEGNLLLKTFELIGIRNLSLIINHPSGIQESKKIINFANELILETNSALEFYKCNVKALSHVDLKIGMQLGVSDVQKLLDEKWLRNVTEINVSIYDKEINEYLIDQLVDLSENRLVNLRLNCHLTYPNLSDMSLETDTLSKKSLKLLSDFHKYNKDKSSLTYEVFLFFVENSTNFTSGIDYQRVTQLYVCHPGPNTSDFRKLNWNNFTRLKMMNIKVLHLFLSYLQDCLPPNLQKLKLNFGSFRSDIDDTKWIVPNSIIELEIDTFPTGEGPMERLLSEIDWSHASVRKLSLCWNKVFDSRGHLILLVKNLPESLELLDIAGCGYEVVLICEESPSSLKHLAAVNLGKRILYSGEYGSVVLKKGENQYPLQWMNRA